MTENQIPSIHSQPFFEPEINSIAQFSDFGPVSENAHDWDFVKKIAKLGFKYCLALKLSKTNQIKYFSELLDLFATESPSKPVLEYARDVFLNPSRIEKYFDSHFNKFDFFIQNIAEECDIYYTDPKSLIKALIEIPIIRDSLFFTSESKPYLESILDGSKCQVGENRIHILLYYDDFAPLLNQNFSNATQYKCSTIYLKIANVSPLVSSKRSCVLPFAIFYAKDFKDHKQQIFDFLNEKLNVFVSSNIILDDICYSFRIAACVSDNLAAHELLGMTLGFRASHFRRFCLMSKEECQHIYSPIKALFRSKKNMKQDLATFRVMGGPSKLHVNGIIDSCLLEGLADFDSGPYSFVSCISHDIFEKVCVETLNTVIWRMDHEKLLDMDQIYRTLHTFEYNAHDRQNPINFLSKLSSMSASQGRMFCRTFLLALKGKLPYDNPLFNGFLHLVRIADMIMAPYFYKSWYKSLTSEIDALLRFVRFDPNLSIYPKLHFVIHYPDLIKMYGPIRLFSTDQFESAHRHFKERLITSNNHKDVIKTMFSGALYKYSYLYSNDFLADSCIKPKKLSGINDDPIITNISSLFSNENVKFLASLAYFGFSYKIGYFIYDQQAGHQHFFWEITHIFQTDDDFHIRGQRQIFEYVENLHSYKRIDSPKSTHSIIDVSEIWIEPIEPYTINSDLYICPPYKFFE